MTYCEVGRYSGGATFDIKNAREKKRQLIIAAIHEMPRTVDELIGIANVTRGTVTKLLKTCARIVDWRRQNGYDIALYGEGVGEDAPKPERKPTKDYKALRAKEKEGFYFERAMLHDFWMRPGRDVKAAIARLNVIVPGTDYNKLDAKGPVYGNDFDAF